MISASHNRFDDNGIKLFGPDGFKLSDSVESDIEALIDGDLSQRLAPSADLGRARRIDGVHDRYIDDNDRCLFFLYAAFQNKLPISDRFSCS